jgi:hypothetical protein
MKLIDRLRTTDKFGVPPHITDDFYSRWSSHAREVKQALDDPQLPIITADNVAEYYYQGTDQEYWDLRQDFPNLAPPFSVFWIEHKMQTRIHSKEKGDTDMGHLGMREPRSGFLFGALKADARTEWGSLNGTFPEGTHWLCGIEMFTYWGLREKGDAPEGPTGTFFLYLDKAGRAIDVPQLALYTNAQALENDPQMVEVLKHLMQWAHPALLTISFLHCKNVKTVEEKVSDKLAKRTLERHGYKPSPHHTLIIEPLKDILRKEGGHASAAGGNTLQKALHICRGHFRDYREGKGLFGKYHQMVWTPQTVRGTSHSKGEKPAPREIEVKLT